MASNSTLACTLLGERGTAAFDSLQSHSSTAGIVTVSVILSVFVATSYIYIIIRSCLSVYQDLRKASVHNETTLRRTRGKPTREGTRGDEWFKMFKKYDLSGSGMIPKADFAKYVQDDALSLGIRPSQATILARTADLNKDGFIDFAEFAQMMMEIRKMRTSSISLKATRFMLPRRQQTEATVEILDGNWCPPPIFLIILALVEIFDYFYQAHVCGWTQECVPDYLFMINFERTLQLWRPFTFFLYHLSVKHLFGNIVGQFVFGATLELVHRWRIVAIFLLGSVSSGLFAIAVHNPVQKQMGGASGGVYALVAAHFANVVLNWKEMKNALVHIVLVSCYVIYTVVTSAALALDGVSTSTSYAGHFGGFVGGVLLGLLLLRNAVQEKWETKVKIGALAAYALFTLGCIVIILVRYDDRWECSI